tara:strand:+ start:547 stop:1815 length:1269 start_codon:yes stop_codon:yes gene_type:complete
MATFEAQVEGLTQIAITSSSAPTQDELSQFLTDGATDVISKVIILRPQDSSKFASEVTDANNSGIVVNGVILNVGRYNGNTEDIRPASPIDSNHRFLATQKSSLHFRSALNPGFYVLNTKLFVVPAPTNQGTQVIASQISYPTVAFGDSGIGSAYNVQTGVTATAATPTVLTKASHGFSNGDVVKLSGFTEATELNGITAIVEGVAGNNFQLDGIYVDGDAETTGGRVETVASGFPNEYEPLVALYASSMSCMAAANDIHNNMPTNVVKLNPPVFDIPDVDLPSPPFYTAPALDYDLRKVNAHLASEDLEMAEKEMEKLAKNLDKTKTLGEESAKVYNNDLEIYKTTIENATKNKDRKTQQIASEYRSDLYKHQQEVAQFQAELQESMAKYKWYMEQSISLMNQYNNSLGMAPPQPKEQQGE